jgi:hypothetical protein
MIHGQLSYPQISTTLTGTTFRDALARRDPVWEALFPPEQERIVRLLVERGVSDWWMPSSR